MMFFTAKIRALYPRVIDRREIIRGVPDRWRQQYPDNRAAEDKIAIGAKLDRLDLETTTAAEIAAIIGNESWTKLGCDVCELDRDSVISVPREYESAISVCRECAEGIADLFAQSTNEAEHPAPATASVATPSIDAADIEGQSIG